MTTVISAYAASPCAQEPAPRRSVITPAPRSCPTQNAPPVAAQGPPRRQRPLPPRASREDLAVETIVRQQAAQLRQWESIAQSMHRISQDQGRQLAVAEILAAEQRRVADMLEAQRELQEQEALRREQELAVQERTVAALERHVAAAEMQARALTALLQRLCQNQQP